MDHFCSCFEILSNPPPLEYKYKGSLTGELEFPAAGVAVVFGSEVSDGVVSQVGRSKYHIIGPAVTISADVRLKDDFLVITPI